MSSCCYKKNVNSFAINVFPLKSVLRNLKEG